MFLGERDSLVYREHYKDLLREAEKARLVRQAQAGQERRKPLYCRALTWIGGRLIVWGWRLQARYGAMSAALALRAANRTH